MAVEDFKITETIPRKQWTATSGQEDFVIPFRFFDDDDIEVYIDDATTPESSSTYSITGAGTNSDGTLSFNTGRTAGEIVTIVRNSDIERTTNFLNSGDWQASNVNNQMNRLTTFIQEVALKSVDLAVTLPITTTLASLAFPTPEGGAVIKWNDAGTALENGPQGDDVQTVADNIANVNIVATDLDGSDTIGTVAADITDVSTVAGISSHVVVVSGVSADVTAVYGNAANITIVATDLDGSDTIGTVATNITNVNLTGGSIANVNLVGGSIANVNLVGPKIDDVETVSNSIDDVETVADSISDVNDCADNMAAIIAAPTEASNAASSASAAATAQTATEAARDATLAAFDDFDDRYLGAKAADPTLDNDGDPLEAGMIYFNTGDEVMKVYTGSVWVAAYVSGTDFLAIANNLSDLADASAARGNLGLVIGTDVQAYSAILAATTQSFTTALKNKLDAIEANADVTDTANVTAAGALMDSEVDADLKTLSLPANTTISAFGRTLVDDANAAAARTTLDVYSRSEVDGLLADEYLHVVDEKASGVNGGAASVGANTRTLNTVKTNTITGASLSSDQITLPAGTYRFKARAPFYSYQDNFNTQLYLYNVTDASVVRYGGNTYANGVTGAGFQLDNHVSGEFTITDEKDFELRHYSDLSEATYGLGYQSVGHTNTFAEIEIWKVPS